MYCDLHTHSTFSDGTCSPTTLVREASEIGLSALALTDHNTVDGLDEFFAAAREHGLRAIGGVEFSTDYGETELHLLALFVEERHYAAIRAYVESLVVAKREATDSLIENLIAAGYAIDPIKVYEGVRGIANRAHVATELVRCGYVGSVEEAFATLLAKDGAYYVQAKRPDFIKTVSFIKSHGMVAVLAHPFLELDEESLRELLPKAKDAGLDGMEVYYSRFNDEKIALAKQIAEEYGILPSGGSDYHGTRKPGIYLGSGRGNLCIGAVVLDELEKRAK